MKRFFRSLALGLGCALPFVSIADSSAVNGYFKKDGAYDQRHVRATPHDSKIDGESTKGNVSPDGGKEGTKEPNPRRNRR